MNQHSEHHHHEHCGCGEHHHEHSEHCGCGHTHAPIPIPEGLTPLQVDFLVGLYQRKYLPIACFSLTNSNDTARYTMALEPVYISAPEDSMEQVKQLGKELLLLESMDLIAIDYDATIQNYAYQEYKTSTLYAYFVKTVAEAAARPAPTFDTPNLELGSMCLTEAGEKKVIALAEQASHCPEE